MTVLVFLLHELSTELKNAVFNFLNLVKSTSFCSKTLHKHYVYEFLLLLFCFFFEKLIYRNFLVLLKLDQNTKSNNLRSYVTRGKFGHTGTMERFDLFIWPYFVIHLNRLD